MFSASVKTILASLPKKDVSRRHAGLPQICPTFAYRVNVTYIPGFFWKEQLYSCNSF